MPEAAAPDVAATRSFRAHRDVSGVRASPSLPAAGDDERTDEDTAELDKELGLALMGQENPRSAQGAVVQ